MYCRIHFGTPIWKPPVVDLFPQTFNKNTLKCIPIKYSVASKYNFPQWFDVWHSWFFRRPSELHHITVRFCVYIAGCLCLEHVLKASQYDGTAPFFRHLWNYNFNEVHALSAAAAGNFIMKCNRQSGLRHAPHFELHANSKAERKLMIEMVSNESNICGFFCTCRPLAHFLTHRAISSLSWDE